MKERELFEQALGLTDPWRVKKVEFSQEEGRLDIWLDFPKGAVFRCPSCGQGERKAYDTEERTWRHLNFFQYLTFLHARTPRISCEGCGVKTVEVPWARPGSGFTLLFEAFLMTLAPQMPVSAISRLTGEHDTRIWRSVSHWVDAARSKLDLSGLSEVGLDETSRARGHSYVTLFCDLEPESRRVVFALPGKGSDTLAGFSRDLADHGGDPASIDLFCCDMSPAFISGIGRNFPSADIVFDRFHVKKVVSCAVDEVRRQERSEQECLKRSRYLWLKRPENLKEKQRRDLDELLKLPLRTARAYSLSQALDVFWELPAPQAEAYLYHWFWRATHSRLAPMRQAAHTIRSHWEGVVSWHKHKVNNGVLEGINSLVQASKARARGYRNPANLITMIYLIAGKLDYELPVPCRVTHTK